MLDYRESHKDPRKGVEYHAKFSDNPYRSMIWSFEKRVLSDVIKRHELGGARHLDFACGTGRVIQHLKQFTSTSLGVDVSESMLKVARSEMPEAQFINIDLTREQLDQKAFNLITAFRFFANAQDDLRSDAMRTLANMLAPDGVLVFNNHKTRASAVYRVGRIVRKNQRDMSTGDVMALVRDSGLRVVEIHHVGVFPSIDRLRLMPIALLRFLEGMLSKVSWLGPFASNRIFVCKLTSSR